MQGAMLSHSHCCGGEAELVGDFVGIEVVVVDHREELSFVDAQPIDGAFRGPRPLGGYQVGKSIGTGRNPG